MNAFIRLLYAGLVAISLVAFLGVGLYSIYQPPHSPTYPNYNYSASQSAENEELQGYNKDEKSYEHRQKSYFRNSAIILLVFAAAICAVTFYVPLYTAVIREGLALGGVATTVYAIIDSAIAGSSWLRFISVTVLLVSVILLVEWRFRHSHWQA